MVLILFFLWRTLKPMPKTKPQEIKPDSASSVKWTDIAGVDEAKRSSRRSSTSCAIRSASRRSAPRSEGRPAARPARHGQDAARQGGRQRVRRAVLRPVGVVIRRDVRRPGRGAHPPAVPRGPQERSGDHLHRRARCGRRPRAARTTTPSASRRSTSCWWRWTASAHGERRRDRRLNLLDKLDPALLRPGRFDRQIFVTPPDVKGRREILGVHTATSRSPRTSTSKVARRDRGADRRRAGQHLQRGGDLSAARQGRSALAQADFDYALERVVAGMETPRTLNERERTSSPTTRPATRCAPSCSPARPQTHSHLDRPARRGARLHAALPRGGPLPGQPQELDGPARGHSSAAARPSRSSSVDHQRGRRRPAQGCRETRRMIHEWAMGTSVSALQLAAEGGAVSDRTRVAARRRAAAPGRPGDAPRRAPHHRPPRPAGRASYGAARPRGARA